MNSQHIVIIGCGVSGLASAIAIAEHGYQVTVVEQQSKPRVRAEGILIQPTGAVALNRLALLQGIEKKASPIQSLTGFNEQHKKIIDIQYSDYMRNSHGLGIHPATLLSTLLAKAYSMNVTIECGFSVAGIVRKGRGYILSNAQCDGQEIYGDGVVIANGTFSSLADELGLSRTLNSYLWGGLWAICEDHQQQFSDTLSQRYLAAEKMISILPSGKHPKTGKPCVSFFWSMAVADYQSWRSTPFAQWKQEVLAVWPELESLLASLQDHRSLAFTRYANVDMKSWHYEGILVVGDAAHGMSPQLGMGTDMALWDAIVLGDCLTGAPSIEKAFADYSRQRKNHVAHYQQMSRFLTPFFQSHQKVAPFCRDLLFPLLHKIPFSYKQMLRTMVGEKTGILFDDSVL